MNRNVTGRSSGPAGRSMVWWPQFLLILTMLLAFGLRAYELDGPSMWSDEGLSLYRARQSLADIAANTITVDGIDTRDTNPPLYFFLLHGLRAVAGESVFALRFLGVVAGVLSVPLLYRLGRRAYCRNVGLLAALLLALSPFHIWQSQDMRNYALLIFFNLVLAYGLLRFLQARKRRGRWLFLWIAAGLLGVYTHYFGFFVLAFGLLVWLMWGARSLWRRKQIWIGVFVALLLLVPVALPAADRFLAGRQIDFVPVPAEDMISHALSVYSVGIIPSVVHPWWRIAPALLLLATGLGLGWQLRRRTTLLVVAYLTVPLALLILLSFINPLYNGPRHLLIGLPPFLLLLAAGIGLPTRPARWLTGLVGVALLLIQASWLQTQFSAPELTKDDVRGAAYYLNEVARPGDVIVLHDTLIGFTFNYYYDGPAPWVAIPAFLQHDVSTAEAALAETAAGADRLWFLTEPTPRTGFPRHELTDWVSRRWPHFYAHRFRSLWLSAVLVGYLPEPHLTALPPDVTELDVAWDNGLRLTGVAAERQILPGQSWWPDFYWTGGGESAELALSIRLTDEHGRLWAQRDRPLAATYPPEEWPAEALVRMPHHVLVPAGLPPGDYQVWLRLVDGQSGQPLATVSGQIDVLVLNGIQVEPDPQPSLLDLPDHNLVSAEWEKVELVGYKLPEVASYRPGHLVPLDLYWHVQRPPDQELELVAQLVDEVDQLVAETMTTPTRASYPSSLWQPGELLHGQVELVIPPQARTGTYRVRIGLREAGQTDWLPVREGWSLFRSPMVALDTVQVEAWPLVTELPALSHEVGALLGEPPLAELAGFELSAPEVTPGETFSLTLFWQAQRDIGIRENYKVFIHLMDDNGTLVAQQDGLPVHGARLTTSWRQNEVLEDSYQLSIQPDVQPGEYTLWAGMYDPENGARPYTEVDGQPQPDGRVRLGTITVSSPDSMGN